MKLHVLVALLVAGCAPIATIATTPEGETANVIFIETQDAPDDAYTKFGRLLAQETYEIRESSSELRTLQTEPRRVMGSHMIRLSISVLENPTRVQVVGTAVAAMGLGENRVLAKGQPGSLNARAWEEMERLASVYDGGSVQYGYRKP